MLHRTLTCLFLLLSFDAVADAAWKVKKIAAVDGFTIPECCCRRFKKQPSLCIQCCG